MNVIGLSQAKNYANQVALGISDMSVSGTTVTFTIVATGEEVSVTLPTPVDGKDGVSITDVELNADNTITCSMSDGSKVTSENSIKTVKGENGFSPTIEVSKKNGVTTLTITDVKGIKIATINDGEGSSVSDEAIAEAVDKYLEENNKSEVSETNTVGFYDTSAFLGDSFIVVPTSESFVATRNFLKFESAGIIGSTTALVENDTVSLYGVDIKLNEDGSVTLNGEATTTFYILSNITDEFRTAIIGQTAKISLFKSDTTSLQFSSGLAFNDATYGYNLTQTKSYTGVVTEEMMSGCSRLEVKTGVTYDNLTVSAMLELQNDNGYLSEYTKSDCEVISKSTEFSIANYPFIGIVGEHTITYTVEGGSSSIDAEEIEAIKASNPLYGKKVACVGDSLCYGQGFSGGYCTVLAELEKDTTFVNKGVGGSQISSNHANGGNWWIENQLSGVSEDTDYIVCEGYVNDYLTSCELGSISDGYEAELDTTTFYGGMESLCKALANTYTNKRCGFIIAHSHYNSSAAYDNKLYIDAIKGCCDKWGIPYLDLSKIITPIVPIYKSSYYTDGLHYNEAGYRRITPAIRNWIKTL